MLLKIFRGRKRCEHFKVHRDRNCTDKDGPTIWRYNSCYDLPSGEIKNAEAKIKRIGTETIYEIKIPFSELFKEGYVLKTDKTMGFQ